MRSWAAAGPRRRGLRAAPQPDHLPGLRPAQRQHGPVLPELRSAARRPAGSGAWYHEPEGGPAQRARGRHRGHRGAAAAVVVLAGAGILILRSNSDDGTAAVSTPTPAATAGVSPGTLVPAATGISLPTRIPIGTPAPGGSAEPAASLDPGTRSPAPSMAPSRAPAASSTPAPLVADTGFTCGPADFDDPTRGTWRVTEALWGARDKWDELTIVLRREEGRGRTNIGVEAMSPREAAQVSGLDQAPSGRVILITFDGDVELRSAIVAQLSERALDYLNIETTSEATYAMVGVKRDGCYRMVVPAWKKGQQTEVGDTVKLLLDVKYR